MQFKTVGNRIQVLAYRGYDQEKRRAIVKMLGSLCRFTLTYDEALTASMDESEKKELAEFIKKRKIEDAENSLKIRLNHAYSGLKQATEALKAETPLDDPERLWLAIIELQKQLRKSGYPRPKTHKTANHKTEKTSENQETLF